VGGIERDRKARLHKNKKQRITVEQFKIACGVIAMAERSGDDEFVPKIWEDM
jgi:hypothetical protein